MFSLIYEYHIAYKLKSYLLICFPQNKTPYGHQIGRPCYLVVTSYQLQPRSVKNVFKYGNRPENVEIFLVKEERVFHWDIILNNDDFAHFIALFKKLYKLYVIYVANHPLNPADVVLLAYFTYRLDGKAIPLPYRVLGKVLGWFFDVLLALLKHIYMFEHRVQCIMRHPADSCADVQHRSRLNHLLSL